MKLSKTEIIEQRVELLGHYGSDETHAQSAWTSTSRTITEEKRLRIPSLIDMLIREGHHTPFEKSTLHFLVTCDQASHIHLLKHRIGVSINAESARYKELKEDRHYIPEDWPEFLKEQLKVMSDVTNMWYHDCIEKLTPTLGRKRAKETARFFKLMNSQVTMDVSFNFRSFMHFQGLRNSPHAQAEIRDIAKQMLELVENIEGKPFKHTIKSWKTHQSTATPTGGATLTQSAAHKRVPSGD